MDSKSIILVTIVVILSSASVGAVQQDHESVFDDELPDNCARAETVSDGTVTGEIGTPGDVDAIKIDVDEGDYLSVAVVPDAGEVQMHIQPPGNPDHPNSIELTKTEGRPKFHEYTGKKGYHASPTFTHATVFKLFAEESGTLCYLLTETSDEASIPYSYEFRFATNSEPSWWTQLRQEITTTANATGDDYYPPTPVAIETPTGTLTSTETPTQSGSDSGDETTEATEAETTATTESTAGTGESGESQDSDGDGVPDSEDYAPRDPDVQNEADVESSGQGMPGFTWVTAVAGLLTAIGIAMVRRRRE